MPLKHDYIYWKLIRVDFVVDKFYPTCIPPVKVTKFQVDAVDFLLRAHQNEENASEVELENDSDVLSDLTDIESLEVQLPSSEAERNDARDVCIPQLGRTMPSISIHTARKKLYRRRRNLERIATFEASNTTGLKRVALKRTCEANTRRPTVVDINAADLPATSTAWTGIRQPVRSASWSVDDILKQGFQLIKWEGNETHHLVDLHNRILVTCLGMPKDKEKWLKLEKEELRPAIQTLRSQCRFQKKQQCDRRAQSFKFLVVTRGRSFGGGQKVHPLD
jgi:hypothetical protein